ncbi:glucose 1-dehydrogenase [Parapedobacter koreensis]|uniref:NAD(P)-dependent dehydrogenase, short-chain alcohol dehydrogenase family n=1 Tax=Parapedobacter koreensis TaxID=332977 RepID=A0A1H7MJY1_9SPHI|nr:glucose 1-dehydrogenase [Parapedobacter koreensis]SEL10985.1 NAD(P)-dependent dehydrogenase, short-chain alcohol dehydrogenase family [Parapedobacter koreensis]
MSKKLENKIALITGGHSGIGLSTAKRFVDEGAYVFIAGRRQDELEKARNYIGHSVTTIQADVTKAEDLNTIFQTIKKEKNSLDVLVASAGIIERVLMEHATPEHFDRIFDVNVKAPYFLIQKILPLLREGSSIVLVSSTAHLIGVPEHSVYSASKAALRSFSRTLAAELKDLKIRVNNLSPGPVDTPIFDGQATTREEVQALKDAYAQWIPMGRIGNPEELAAAALFLASDESSFSTGIDLVADGGQTQL